MPIGTSVSCPPSVFASGKGGALKLKRQTHLMRSFEMLRLRKQVEASWRVSLGRFELLVNWKSRPDCKKWSGVENEKKRASDGFTLVIEPMVMVETNRFALLLLRTTTATAATSLE